MSQEIIDRVSDLRRCVEGYLRDGKKVIASSSFQSHSIPMLHILRSVSHEIPIYFLDTGFHFPETLRYRDHIGDMLDLDVRIIHSPIPKINQMDSNGRFFFCSNTDYCCHINKVLPLEPYLRENDIWITGVRADQSKQRSKMTEFMEGPYETERYHPMLSWNSKMIWEYRKLHDLPSHPLEAKGYLSVGCAPCTVSALDGDRQGRWSGQKKEECGLHIELVKK